LVIFILIFSLLKVYKVAAEPSFNVPNDDVFIFMILTV
jgi:hypothetical protein